MKCPYCNYEDGWSNDEDKMKIIDGDEGSFYSSSLPIMKRACGYYNDQEDVALLGCPKCKKVFID
jgi:hypothetical protein